MLSRLPVRRIVQHGLTAFDNRGAGRSPMPPESWSVAGIADDAAEILRALGIDRAHVCGFSGGSCTAQDLALRHPGLVRSLVLVSTWARSDAFLRAMTSAWTWLPAAAPTERAMLEAFFTWIYTPRAHDSGIVDAIIEEALAFPHTPSRRRRSSASSKRGSPTTRSTGCLRSASRRSSSPATRTSSRHPANGRSSPTRSPAPNSSSSTAKPTSRSKRARTAGSGEERGQM